jgi:hypothetical protein
MQTAIDRATALTGVLAATALLVILTAGSVAARPATDPRSDPPAVDEAALARRLFDMTQPQPGERAIIVFDPTYYPGITTRLREALHDRGVHTYAVVEDTPAMIDTYLGKPPADAKREQDVVAALLPLFRSSQIFYWMPTRGYGDDLRWERLVAESRVRSVHFHWMLRFPGTRTADEILATARATERRSLEVDLAEHARNQRRLAAALRGTRVRITTPSGTDLTLRLPADQWFHLGDGDASKARAETARSIRDRQMELPVGMFGFVPDAATVTGRIVAPSIAQAGESARDIMLALERGRVVRVDAQQGEAWIRDRMRDTGPDGDRIGTVLLNTNPLVPPHGLVIDIGANWENGGRNRAEGMQRMTIRLTDATVTAGDRVVMRNGAILWAEIVR